MSQLAAKFPKSNFSDVVPAQLKKGKYQSLVLQAGSVDITNLNTKDYPSQHLEYFKQETIISAQNFFLVGENALATTPSC